VTPITAGIVALGGAVGFLVSPLGLVAAALVAGGYAFFKYSTAGQQALTYLGSAFQGLKTDAVDTFKGIGDALKAGDISLAGSILFAGLKLETVKGLQAITELWHGWAAGVRQIYADTGFALVRSFNTAFGAVRKALVQFRADMASPLDAIKDGLVPNAPAIALRQLGIEAKPIDPRKQAIADEQKRIDEQTAADNANLGAGQVTDKQERDAANQKAIADAAKAVADARAEFDALKLEASGKAEFAAKAVKKPTLPGLDEAALDSGLAKAKRTTEVKGTFSASALRGISTSDSVTDAVKEGNKEAKKHTEQLNKINRSIERGAALT
jgi:hypothetical protein